MKEYVWWYPVQIVESKKIPIFYGTNKAFSEKRHKNNLYKAVRKTGKQFLIRMDLFDEWLDKQGKQFEE